MKFNNKYRITLEDESSLEKKINFSARFPILILLIIAFTIIAGAFGIFVLASTPMKNHLPGYLKESERTATEEQHLRLDSLVKVYEVNEAYVSGILKALNPSEKSPNDSIMIKHIPLAIDSLLPVSEVEKEFMESIRERDKYNIDYASPAAAQTMMFGSVNNAAVISEDTKNNYKTELIIPMGSHVTSVAEGKVISVASSPRASGGYEIIIQHPKGFLSKTSHLSKILVQPGDKVIAGQIIANGTAGNGIKNNHVIFELWRDGDPLLPYLYLNGGV